MKKFIIRHGILPLIDIDRFFELFFQMKSLQMNLNSFDDLKHILSKYLKIMPNLLTLKISILGNQSSNDMPQWQGIVNNMSYELGKKHIKIWK